MSSRSLPRRCAIVRPTAPAAIVLAAIAAAGPAPAGADPPGDGDLIRDPDAARAVVQRAVDAYRSLHSYRHTASMTWHVETGRWPESLDQPEDRTETGSLAFAAPDYFAVTWGSLSAYCDAATLWVHDGDLQQYIQVPRQEVSGPIDQWLKARTSQKLRCPFAGKAMIDRESRIDDILNDLVGFDGLRPGERDGRPGRWVAASIRDTWYRSGEGMKIEMWFDDRTGLLEELRGDYTDAYAFAVTRSLGFASDEVAEVRSATWVSTYGERAVNEELAPATFVFQPGPGDRRVDVFEGPKRVGFLEAERQQLVGQPAPDFSGKTLEGEEVTLAGLRGRVVLLDFWATWCGPCVRAIPDIQEISAHFAEAPVTVLGINGDGPGKDETVRKFLKKKGITFTQVMDRQASISTSYRLGGIPTTVLIDQRGVLRDASVGFSPAHKAELIEQIDALLEGREPPVAKADEDDLLRMGAFGQEDPALLAMIGQPLPDFSATELGGREVSPAAIRGQVALLYFWMRSGREEERRIGSGDRDLHRSIQRLVDRLDGEPFRALGICRSMHDRAEDVRKWLEDNQITVPQVYEETGEITDRYAVHMYPCLLLIDKGGVVQEVTTGQRPNMDLLLEDKITRLLAGESLIDLKQLELRKKAAEALAKRFGFPSGERSPVDVKSVASDRLLKASRLSGDSTGYQSRFVDLDGDGADEIVLCGAGEVRIVSSDGAALRRIRLAGLDDAQITDLEPVFDGGELRWFAAAMSWQSPRRGAHVGLFGPDGRELWTFVPPQATGDPDRGEIAATAALAAGDLDGDGAVEFLVGATYVQWTMRDDSAFPSPVGTHMTAQLFVLDRQGTILSQTKVGQSISLLEVVPPPRPGAPATILCGTDAGLDRYAFEPGRGAKAQP